MPKPPTHAIRLRMKCLNGRPNKFLWKLYLATPLGLSLYAAGENRVGAYRAGVPVDAATPARSRLRIPRKTWRGRGLL